MASRFRSPISGCRFRRRAESIRYWRADGRELLYQAPDRAIMAVSVTIAGNSVSLGKPVELFRVHADAGGSGTNWTPNRDHTRFVVVEAPNEIGQTFRVLTRWR